MSRKRPRSSPLSVESTESLRTTVVASSSSVLVTTSSSTVVGRYLEGWLLYRLTLVYTDGACSANGRKNAMVRSWRCST